MHPRHEGLTSTNAQLAAGFCLSLALHAVLLVLLINRELLPPPRPVFDVDFIVQPPAPAPAHPVAKPPPPAQAAARQIVSPPEAGRSEPPKETALLSDVDSFAETEQLRRGDGLDAGPAPGPGIASPGSARAAQPNRPKNRAEAPPREPAPQKEPAPRSRPGAPAAVKQLDLSPDYQMLQQLQTAAEQKPKSSQGTASIGSEPQPFSRAAGAGARFIGFNGATDFMPGIRDGDITLLNAKADKYAVFVRRVATQVFQHLRQNGWNSLQAGDIQAIHEYAAVRAKLSADGSFMSAELIGNSQSGRFDAVLKEAVRAGARDPHPPPDAKTGDGTFVFIFLAKSWVRLHSDPRTGMLGEQRWLLLKTGLE